MTDETNTATVEPQRPGNMQSNADTDAGAGLTGSLDDSGCIGKWVNEMLLVWLA